MKINFGIDYILELFAALFSIAIASLIFHNDFTERYSEIICNQEIIIHAY